MAYSFCPRCRVEASIYVHSCPNCGFEFKPEPPKSDVISAKSASRKSALAVIVSFVAAVLLVKDVILDIGASIQHNFKFGVVGPKLVASVESVDFGVLSIGESFIQTITVTNHGEEDARLIKMQPLKAPFLNELSFEPMATGSCASLQNQFEDLSPNDSCTIKLQFRPDFLGSFSEIQLVTYGGLEGTTSISILLNGETIR